jgi:4'-phosphopantetheinyl transferase
MPVVQHTNLNENTVLALWKIDETKEELTDMLGGAVADSGTNLHASLHWLASRVLLKQLFAGSRIQLYKDEFNKPSLEVDSTPYHISISHSHEYAVIVVNAAQPVAIDIEKIDDRVIRVAHKFIREDEQAPDDERRTLIYTIIWSAKETLYKYYSKKQLDFRQHLRIEPFDVAAKPLTIKGHIHKELYDQPFSIRVLELEGYVLTCIC